MNPDRYKEIIEIARRLYDIVIIAAYTSTSETCRAISSAADRRLLFMTQRSGYIHTLCRYATNPEAYGINGATTIVAFGIGDTDAQGLLMAAGKLLPGTPSRVLHIDAADGTAIQQAIYEQRFAEHLNGNLLERFHELSDEI